MPKYYYYYCGFEIWANTWNHDLGWLNYDYEYMYTCTVHYGFVLLILFTQRWLYKQLVFNKSSHRPTWSHLLTLLLVFRETKLLNYILEMFITVIKIFLSENSMTGVNRKKPWMCNE